MNIRITMVSLVAAVLALTLAGSGSAWADGGRHHDRHSYGQQGKHHKHYKHYKRGKHGKHYKYKRPHYGGGYGRPGSYYYNYEDDDDNEKLLIGLVVGGLVGYAINNAQQEQAYEYERAAPGYGYPGSGGYDSSCLQEREYQTTVIVGGKEVPAYGSACLQPDGSWRRSPARLANY